MAKTEKTYSFVGLTIAELDVEVRRANSDYMLAVARDNRAQAQEALNRRQAALTALNTAKANASLGNY